MVSDLGETSANGQGKYAVYLLKDPAGLIRYVGISVDPEKRFRGHLKDKGEAHRCRWIASLLRKGQQPTLHVVERTDDWQEAERRWIAEMRKQGCKLVNSTDGGLVIPKTCRVTYPHIKHALVDLGQMLHWMKKHPSPTADIRRNKLEFAIEKIRYIKKHHKEWAQRIEMALQAKGICNRYTARTANVN